MTASPKKPSIKRITGKALRIGDTIQVWWQPNTDTIIGLTPYKGPLEYVWPKGARLASFALNKSGMTIDNTDVYNVISRR